MTQCAGGWHRIGWYLVLKMRVKLNCVFRSKWNWIHINMHFSRLQRARWVNVSLFLYPVTYTHFYSTVRTKCVSFIVVAAAVVLCDNHVAIVAAAIASIFVVRCVQIAKKNCSLNCDVVLSAIYESHWPNMEMDRMLLIECKCKQIPAWLIFYKPHGRIAILLLYVSLSFCIYVSVFTIGYTSSTFLFFLRKIAEE